jgi:hypothetical protein
MKKRCGRVSFVLVIYAALFWPGCSQTATEPIPAGAYSYESYNNNGVAIVGGWFTMSLSDTGTISGEWHFKAIGTPENIGPQTGDGTLIGGMDKGRVWIELNPQFRDNNLQLDGKIDGNRYSGKWVWISFVGVANQGTFEATRN